MLVEEANEILDISIEGSLGLSTDADNVVTALISRRISFFRSTFSQ